MHGPVDSSGLQHGGPPAETDGSFVSVHLCALAHLHKCTLTGHQLHSNGRQVGRFRPYSPRGGPGPRDPLAWAPRRLARNVGCWVAAPVVSGAVGEVILCTCVFAPLHTCPFAQMHTNRPSTPLQRPPGGPVPTLFSPWGSRARDPLAWAPRRLARNVGCWVAAPVVSGAVGDYDFRNYYFPAVGVDPLLKLGDGLGLLPDGDGQHSGGGFARVLGDGV